MDHDNRYWFPAKRYGWGWGPPTMWQGWVVTAVWFGALFLGLWMIGLRQSPVIHVAFMIGMSCVLIAVCYWKGEPPALAVGRRQLNAIQHSYGETA
jgi:drug/metabolite transporter (DMT)-like permease